MNHKIRQTVFPLLAALIWGTAFSAQSVASTHLGPLTFNALRSVIAFFALLVLDLIVSWKTPGRRSLFQLRGAQRRRMIVGGCACGVMLALACNVQQLGIADTSAGKTGFITAMYIVIVPLFGLFQRKRLSWTLWVSVALAAAGLYFLCVKENFTVAPSDLIVLLCAFFYAGHILVIDRFSEELDGIQMSCVQFFAVMVLSSIGMFLMESPALTAVALCIGPILYCGFFSSAVGYTLQILAQRDANPTVVSLLLSLESVFAVLGGAVLLQEQMGVREILGCVLMMMAVILAQLPAPAKETTILRTVPGRQNKE